MKKTLKFRVERETKGAVRFHEIDSDGREIESPDAYTVGVLYLRKHALRGMEGLQQSGGEITVTIEG